ncbi:MAG TPA: PAS domain S-box protein [Burkholderiales bacterium]|jgi:PAS domain S-box-containing protein|nr:PAS domain S-box protein [Burkholderiales bacterium]
MSAILTRVTEVPYIAKVGVLAICYFAAAKASLLFAIPPGYATAVWPPAGIALAALLLHGVRTWPGVWLGAVLANFSIDQSLSVAAVIATGNTLEAACAVMLVNRLIDSTIEFRQPHVVFRFALIAAASSLVAATSGVGALFVSGSMPAGSFLDNWYTWWQGDTTAIIVVTPLLLAWLREPHREEPLRRTEVFVFGVLLALTFVAVFVFAGWSRPGIGHALPFLLIPFMAWAGCRFDERVVTAAIFAVTILAIWGTVNKLGPFASADLNESLLSLQAFTSTVTLMSLVLCALNRERTRAAVALQRSHDRLELTVSERTAELAANVSQLAGDVAERERLASVLQRREAQLAQAQAITHTGSWTWDLRTDRVTWSDELFRIYGLSPEEFSESSEAYISRVHPQDRQRVQEVIRKARADHQPWELTERIIRPDGVIRVLKTTGNVLIGEDGAVTAMHGVCADTTEQIRVERIQAVQNGIAQAMVEETTSAAVLVAALRIICDKLGWDVGAMWKLDPVRGVLFHAHAWHPAEKDASVFITASRQMQIERGRGLPGRIWEQEKAVWIEDVFHDSNFPRAAFAAQANLRAAFGFPLTAGRQVMGIMEFFGTQAQKPDDELLAMIAAVGNQLGEYVVRNEAQALLRESEERFRLLVERVKDFAIFMLDPEGRIASWNSGAQQIKGYRAEEVVGKHFSCFYPPEDIASGQPDHALEIARTVGRHEAEGWRVRKDGSRFLANVVITPVRADDGGLRGYTKVTRDITQSRRSEDALRHSETLLGSVLDTLPVGVWVMDREGKIIRGNPAGKKIWAGARRVDFKQHSEYKGWWAGTDRLIQPHEWAAARAIERGETTINELVDIECFDGSRKTILNSAVPLRDSEGRITGGIIVNEDVTARKLAEEALAVIAAGISAATGAEFFRLLVQQVAQALAVDGAIIGELTGKKEGEVRTIAGIMDGKMIDNFTYDCRGGPCALVLTENTVVHSDDTRSRFAHTPVLDRFSADTYVGIGLWAADEAVLGVMMVINRKPLQNPDLAKSSLRIFASRAATELERKRNEETIRSLAIRLQEMIEEERTRIAREIHDELGQALTGLKMDLSWLSKSVEKRDSKVTAQIKSMSEFIDSLIHSVRRISTKLRPGELDDLGLVAAIESQAQEFESRTGIKCRLSLPEADVAVDPAVATAVFRICQELLTNVARHSGATRVNLDLGCNGAWLSLAVQDDGRGIRAAEVSNRHAIGLAGIRERAKMFGGSVTIKGKPGKGTLAQVRIPMSRARASAHGNGDAATA